jgi:hypothetical protein
MFRTDTTDYGKRVCILNTTCDAAKKYKQYDLFAQPLCPTPLTLRHSRNIMHGYRQRAPNIMLPFFPGQRQPGAEPLRPPTPPASIPHSLVDPTASIHYANRIAKWLTDNK